MTRLINCKMCEDRPDHIKVFHTVLGFTGLIGLLWYNHSIKAKSKLRSCGSLKYLFIYIYKRNLLGDLTTKKKPILLAPSLSVTQAEDNGGYAPVNCNLCAPPQTHPDLSTS